MSLLSRTQQLLKSLSHRPLKSWGQNFLIDEDVLQTGLNWARIQPDDIVIEIGPGLGTVTEKLLDCGAEVFAVELDKRLHAFLEKRLKGPQFHLLLGDAVKFPLAEFDSLTSMKNGFKVVANLPYAISSPWLDALLSREPQPTDLVLLLQKETADRFLAPAGSKKRSAIAIRLQSVYEHIESQLVGPECFIPAPKVESTLLHLRKKASSFRFSSKTYNLLRSLFLHRRKQLVGLLERVPDQQSREMLLSWAEEIELERTSRAEEISLENWQLLEKYCQSKEVLLP